MYVFTYLGMFVSACMALAILFLVVTEVFGYFTYSKETLDSCFNLAERKHNELREELLAEISKLKPHPKERE